ncbi:PH domain-containing protein [Oceanobacillus sp. FSL H7-0719]|uniref:PH domain-containing protein n=1 Tax=Oceanobacillus sp. FSL H7-0719 TaxID=2954507 RepID=UPI00324CCFA9
MYFPSIRDKWITIITWAISLAGIILPLVNGQPFAAGIMILLAGFLLWFWLRTGYKIEGEKLKIYYGPIRQTIHIPDIKLVLLSKMPLIAPALSFKRIQISCGKYDVVSISPKNRDKFISMLLDINPDIPMDERIYPKEEDFQR